MTPAQNGTLSAFRPAIFLEKCRGIWGALLPGMMTVLIITAALFAGGFFVEVISAATAPMGYQDEEGFHFGREISTRAENWENENPS
jgi:hypothetical protein